MAIWRKIRFWFWGILAALVAVLLGTNALRRRRAEAAMRRAGARVEALSAKSRKLDARDAIEREVLAESERMAATYEQAAKRELDTIERRILSREERIARLLDRHNAAR